MTRYVVVLGSLMSGLGKGIVTASIAKMLSFYGLNAVPMKFDGYLNYDCGTMNPFRHGEVYVLEDKSEVDMDFGIYERFLNRDMDGTQSITGGKIFSEIIAKERTGAYLGNDVQIIPHLTDLIISKVKDVAAHHNADVMVIEVGGTVGDIENNYFIEAMRHLSLQEQTAFVCLTYVPELSAVGEQKTKPTQIALRVMMQAGIRPDFVVCRCDSRLNETTRSKIALFANLHTSSVIDDSDTSNIYTTPILFMEQGFDKLLLQRFGIKRAMRASRLSVWKRHISHADASRRAVNVAILGKYTRLRDSYASINEAVMHGCAANGVKAKISWVEAEDLERDPTTAHSLLGGADAIIVPGGFGDRGIEGMIYGIRYARERRVPYLGICLGMQLMAVEFARNVCNLPGANSTEFDANARYKIVDIMNAQRHLRSKGGTMRLGSQRATARRNTIAYSSYGSPVIFERHRHRYELNNRYVPLLERHGLVVSATTPDGKLVEIIEWKGSFGIGTQAHPELKSRPERPAPLFSALIKGAVSARAARR